MLTISKPLSAGQARAYHQEEFSNAQENYYSEGERIRGEWHGKLAEKWGLRGGVQEEHAGICERAWQNGQGDGAPRWLGCHILSAEERFVDGTRG